ncbi:MAG: PP2C family protein-serine/threonine phosphatase [Myxococcota bacterium]
MAVDGLAHVTAHPAPTRAAAAAVEHEASGFGLHLNGIIHDWSRIITALGISLIPLFGVLDYFTMPTSLLPRFWGYRAATTLLVVAQYFVIRRTQPGRLSHLHGYVFSLVVGGMIVLMTRDLGGFDSAYYAGLNLVIVAVNVFLPWRAIHSALNGLLVIAMYLLVNGLGSPGHASDFLVNNLFFLVATVVIVVAITHRKHLLIANEFWAREELLRTNRNLDASRTELRAARDALWGEMEMAKHIQTGLLPRSQKLGPYDVTSVMHPAAEVGGDYHDIIRTSWGEKWVGIGDVSGHGVESGLVMMMTQTGIFSVVNNFPGLSPSHVLRAVNAAIRENISRLGVRRYVTLSVIRLDDSGMWMAGKHQDVLILRAATGDVEEVPTEGCWVGVVDDPQGAVPDKFVPLHPGDVALLFTDGVTEATNPAGEFYGQERLVQALKRMARAPGAAAVRNILDDVQTFMARQDDDMTLVLLRHTGCLGKWDDT